MNRTKKSLLMSALSLLLCISMLLGTTWAWFTDTVATTGNRIVAGTLKVDLLHQVTDTVAGTQDWVSLKNEPEHKIFNYDKWEPGYTRLEKLKVDNLGKMALRYQLSTVSTVGTELRGANGERLSDVIDVYLYDGDSTAASFAEVKADSNWVLAGTLSEMQTAAGGFARGNLLPDGAAPKTGAYVGEQTVSVALHMREEAGNEYQNLTVGDMYITLVATQLTHESDSYGDQYDKDSVFPEVKLNYSINAPVALNADNTAANEVKLGGSDDTIKATVPAGTKLEPGTNYLTLSVTELVKTNANITVDDGQQSRSVDVHVSGVADDNTTPIIVTVKSLMPGGYNMGSFELYHVEDGTPVLMTCVYESQLDAHNEYTYDPSTGDVKMALSSFSEVAVVADNHSEWNGGTDVSWYIKAKETGSPSGTDDDPLIIANADQLNGFGQIVGGMAVDTDGNAIDRDDFDGKYIKLIYDIDLGTKEGHQKVDNSGRPYREGRPLIFYPIGYYFTDDHEGTGKHYSTVYSFGGSFNGNGHTVSNFYQNTWDMIGDNEYYPESEHRYRDGMGLFGYVYDGEVKNITVDHFSCDGEFTPTGVIAAYAHAADFINISITNCNPRVYNTGNGGIVGIGGLTNPGKTNRTAINFKNITVDQTNKITALWGSWDVSCSGLMGMLRGPSDAEWQDVNITNCHVAAQIDAYNDVCGNYQYYWYRYSGMLVGSIRKHTTDENGYTIPDTSMITATNCTVHFGEWNNYYYCELVANSIASYTHDHQFSRLTEVASVDAANMKYVTLDGEQKDIPTSGRVNFVTVNGEHSTENATCYHFVDGAVWNHEDAGYESFDLDGNGLLDDYKENNKHIYLPFNKQLFQGYGWGVKNIPVGAKTGITILDTNDGYSEPKFKVRENVEFIAVGYTFHIGDLFRELEESKIKIKSDQVKVTLTKVGSTDDISNHFALKENKDDWTKTRLRFTTTGTFQVTIQDYYYCTATTVTVNVDWYHYAASGIDTVFLMTESEQNNPNANYKTHAYSMTEAHEKLKQLNEESGRQGGDIVIMGNYTQSTLFRAPDQDGKVRIRSIDDISTYWVAPRQTSVGVRYFCGGPTELYDVRIEATKTHDGSKDANGLSTLSWNFIGNFHDVTVDESVYMDRKGNDFILVLGAQGGGINGGAATIEVQDATLNLYGGEWSEVVGSVRTSFCAQDWTHPSEATVRHIDQFADVDYHLEINIGGVAVVDKVFAHSRSMEPESIYKIKTDAEGKEYVSDELWNENIGANASCVINLLGGKVTRFFGLNHFLEVCMGYEKGFTVFVGKDFDLDQSFETTPTQDSRNLAKGYTVIGGISGESVYEYDQELDNNRDGVINGTTVPTVGESVLLIEHVDGIDRINDVKDSGKVRLDTFTEVEYGEYVDRAPTQTNTNVFYVGWTGTGDGKTPETFMNSVGWKQELIVDDPSLGDFDEGTDSEDTENDTATAADTSTVQKYPLEKHLWYYFDNYGGTYVAKQKMYIGGMTAIKNVTDTITFTGAYGGVDYQDPTGTEYGCFIIKNAPVGVSSTGKTIVPNYVRIHKSNIIFDNITFFDRAGSDLGGESYGFAEGTVTDSQTSYLWVEEGARVIIRDSVKFATKLDGRDTTYVKVTDDGVLYLETTGFSRYEGDGTIVLSDELIERLNSSDEGIADLELLRSFKDNGGTLCDKRGIHLDVYAFGEKRLLISLDGSIPTMNDAGTEIEYNKHVYVKDNGTGNGSSAEYPLSLISHAYGALGISGGTIEFCGDFTFTGSGVFTETEHKKPITIVQTSGKFGNDGVKGYYQFVLNGDTTFKDVHFVTNPLNDTGSRGMLIVARYNKVVMENIKLEGFGAANTFANNFVVIGGYNESVPTGDANARSGKESNIVINGVTTVDGSHGISIMGLDRQIAGTNKNDARITINDGEIYRIYDASDMGVHTGKVSITINGGDFTKIDGINLKSRADISSVTVDINGGTFTAAKTIPCLAGKTTIYIDVSEVDASTLAFLNDPTIIED